MKESVIGIGIKSLPFFVLARKEIETGEIESIDLFINEYKRILVKDEQYNLINSLSL